MRQGRFTHHGLQGHFVLQIRCMLLGRHVLKGPCASGKLCFDGTMCPRDTCVAGTSGAAGTMCCRLPCAAERISAAGSNVMQGVLCYRDAIKAPCATRTPCRRHVHKDAM